jgi:Subtilase family
MPRSITAFGRLLFISSVAVLVALPSSAQSSPSIPKNVGAGLRELIEMDRSAVAHGAPGLNLHASDQLAKSAGQKSGTGVFRMHVDDQNRVLVNIHLNNSVVIANLKDTLESMGLSVVREGANYRGGLIAAYMPVKAAEKVAALPGISSVLLAHRSWKNVGAVTSQGASILRSDIANSKGIDGTGITVGLLSDSFNTSPTNLVPDRAADDVKSGDLPNTAVIPGEEGLVFAIDLPTSTDPNFPNTDEGRGMAQIVHDIAPGARLCFATADISELDFALNIIEMRINPACHADVIVDDVEYFDEPFFSDGIVAQAVDIVATNNSLPGHKVAYFSSAGNQAKEGYSSDLRIVPDADARANLASLGFDVAGIPATIDTTGGFHNFDPTGGTILFQDFLFADGTIFSFQWDDPFNLNPSGITTDLNLLFFDPATGKFLFAVNDDNFMTNQPIELFQLTTGGPASAEILMVVARTGQGAHLSKKLKYVAFGGILDFNGVVTAQTPITFGHNSARGANGVAALEYNVDPAFFTAPKYDPIYEPFSSPGPVTIFFDANGNRLSKPEIRQKPDIAAVDGVNTSFFPEEGLFGPGQDFEAFFGVPDGFPNFFGTSAAAPHAAGVAALVIQKAGGSGSIDPDDLSRVLKRSAPPRDTDLFFSKAVAFDDDGHASVVITATGEDLAAVGRSNNFFQVTFNSKRPGQTLDSLTMDLTGTGLVFDPVSHPVAAGSTTGPTIASSTPGTVNKVITLNFTGFTSGNTLTFGVDRDFTTPGGTVLEQGGNSGDEVVGATVTAQLSGPTRKHDKDENTLKARFKNDLDRGYQIYDGFGLIDTLNALRQVGHGDKD